MTDLFNSLNDFLWSYILIAALIGCGLWFTWRTRFVQFRMVGEMIRLLGDSAKLATNGQRHISSFQAFAVSVATRVGTGNLAGVATAIAIGGPGAIFWMWLIALMGSATAFVESTLGQLFKQHHEEGFIGGPAYYIQRGLHCRWMSSSRTRSVMLWSRLSDGHRCGWVSCCRSLGCSLSLVASTVLLVSVRYWCL